MLWCKNHICQESQIQIGSTSLANLILTPAPAKIKMDTWKPDATNIMQLLQDFNNEESDVSKLLFVILQGFKLRWGTNSYSFDKYYWLQKF